MNLLTTADAEIMNKCIQHHINNGDDIQLNKKHIIEIKHFYEDMYVVKKTWRNTVNKSNISEFKFFDFFYNFMRSHLSLEVQAFLNSNYNDSILSKISVCIDMILKYHDLFYSSDDECSACMALVMKIFLLIFKAIDFIRNCSTREVHSTFDRYLKLFKIKKSGMEVGKLLFEVFDFNEEEFLEYSIIMWNIDAKLVFDVMQSLKLNKPGILEESHRYLRFEMSHICLFYAKFSNFINLTEYGARNAYEANIFTWYEMLIKESINNYYDFSTLERNKNLGVVKMRAHQVIYFYVFTKNNRNSTYYDKNEVRKIPEALRNLWNSISDPFLTRDNILNTMTDLRLEDEALLQDIWIWYDDHVTKGESKVSAPRSLQHLARCSIRNSLAASFNLPNGVNLLTYPTSLKKYILFEM